MTEGFEEGNELGIVDGNEVGVSVIVTVLGASEGMNGLTLGATDGT